MNKNTATTPDAKTVGKLAAAKIYAATEKGEPRRDDKSWIVHCKFNPYEYSVTKSNSYGEKGKAKASTKLELQKSGPQTLKLSLIFDVFEDKEKGKGADIDFLKRTRDVSRTTKKLWNLMKPIGEDPKKKSGAPFVVFEWGVFKFLAVITDMTQKFTLFDKDGVPLRAKVDVTFTQHDDKTDYKHPTSGGGPAQQVREIVGGDRLDAIAAEVYDDAGKWREIAAYNNISDPLALRPGQRLLIPEVGIG